MEPRDSARDHDIGLDVFLTQTPPLGGRLKVRIDDFIVNEVGGLPLEDPAGPYTCAVIRLTNWETNRFVNTASEQLHISRKKIHFSGTKDKRGVTTQVFTFEAPLDAVQRLGLNQGVQVERAYRCREEAQLGDHTDNLFDLIVRDIPHPTNDAQSLIDQTRAAADQAGGYPNFFGPQRFGAVRATTHRVGERILRGDFEGAVHAYLSDGPLDLAQAQKEEWRRHLQARDYHALMRMTQGDQGFERALLHRMMERPDHPIDALLAFPKNLQLLFVYAYQSFLFNRILSARIRDGIPIGQAVEGDLIAPFEAGQMKEEWIPAQPRNLARINDELRRGRAVVTALLPGTEAPIASGRPGEIEHAVLAAEKLQRGNFVVPEHIEWTSKGSRRAIALRPAALTATTGEDELFPGKTRAQFAFGLPRGAYATSVLREFLKSPALRDYA
jgi:tRNA pseudouridine13 synthase